MLGQLTNPVGVGASGLPDVDGSVVLEDVAAVEHAGRLDMCGAVTEFDSRFVGALGFRPPLDCAGPRDDGKIAVHHDGILDEHAVGTPARWLDLGDPPA